MRTTLASVILLFLAAVSMVPSASAMTVREYTNQRDSADVEGFKTTRVYLSGVGVGYIWANSARAAEKIQPLFCLPQDFLRRTDFPALIDDEIGQTYVTRDDAVELLMLSAMRRLYPCAGAKPFNPDNN